MRVIGVCDVTVRLTILLDTLDQVIDFSLEWMMVHISRIVC